MGDESQSKWFGWLEVIQSRTITKKTKVFRTPLVHSLSGPQATEGNTVAATELTVLARAGLGLRIRQEIFVRALEIVDFAFPKVPNTRRNLVENVFVVSNQQDGAFVFL